MAINLLNSSVRKQIVEETKGSENMKRKSLSFEQYEIFRDRIRPYVEKYLEDFYAASSIKEMPIVSSINMAKRIVTQEASLYKCGPERTFYNVTEEQAIILGEIYEDMKVDTAFLKSNQYYKLQEQNHIYVVPMGGRLKLKVLLAHQLDVVPSTADQEVGEVYIVNGFDRRSEAIKVTSSGDSSNEIIADEDDYQSRLNMAAVWSPLFNFIMDENGNIVSPETENPILGMVPFIDIHATKDGEYWVRSGAALNDFTVQFNGSLTDLQHIIRMQGFAQAWVSGPSELLPQNIKIGPSYVLRLPTDKNNPDAKAEFGFANPNSDIAGSIAYLENLLSMFLTSRGLDPKLVNAKGEASKYSSGFDRLLSMIDQFQPSEADKEIFEDAEAKLFEIIKRYINTYAGTPILGKYNIGQIPEDAYVEIKYHKPQAVVSEQDKLNIIAQKLELGLMTKEEAIAYDREIDQESASEIYKKLEGEMRPDVNG
jgi:hypothetical protein